MNNKIYIYTGNLFPIKVPIMTLLLFHVNFLKHLKCLLVQILKHKLNKVLLIRSNVRINFNDSYSKKITTFCFALIYKTLFLEKKNIYKKVMQIVIAFYDTLVFILF